MRIVSVIFLSFFLQLKTVSAQVRWKAVSSAVTFSIKNAGLNVSGKLSGFQSELNFYPEHLASSSIVATVEANSINTGIDLRDKHLKKEEYFDVAKYPKIEMNSVSFEKLAEGYFKGKFKLTIKKTSKEVVIPFYYTENGNTAQLKGTFTINRRDFEVGGSSWTMSDTVTISILVNASK
jgi:polyisoprenoid-binding protein YceI